MATREPIGPFPGGMDNRSDETTIPRGRCRSAKNIDFDRDGNFKRRDGFVRRLSLTNVHSLYTSHAHDMIFCGQGNTLGIYDPIDNSYTSKVGMPSAYRTDFAELNGTTYASNAAFNCRFPPGNTDAFTIGVDLPTITPTFELSANGGLNAGAYTVAFSVLNADKEESPLSDEVQIQVPQGGGVAVMGVPIQSDMFIRVYVSTPNGEELYLALEAPMTAASFLLGIAEITHGGKQPETRFLSPLPVGHFIEAFRNRLLVASGSSVYWSSSFRPHLCDLRHNFVSLESVVTLMKPINGGVFISDQKKVIFLNNEDPDTFVVEDTDAAPAVFGSGIAVPGSAVSPELSDRDKAIIWLSRFGWMAGLPGGAIQRLNSDRLKLPDYTVAAAAFIEREGIKQIINPVNSERRDGTGTAVDSSIS